MKFINCFYVNIKSRRRFIAVGICNGMKGLIPHFKYLQRCERSYLELRLSDAFTIHLQQYEKSYKELQNFSYSKKGFI